MDKYVPSRGMGIAILSCLAELSACLVECCAQRKKIAKWESAICSDASHFSLTSHFQANLACTSLHFLPHNTPTLTQTTGHQSFVVTFGHCILTTEYSLRCIGVIILIFTVLLPSSGFATASRKTGSGDQM